MPVVYNAAGPASTCFWFFCSEVEPRDDLQLATKAPFRIERDTVPGTYAASTNEARVLILAQCPAQLYSSARYKVLRASPLAGCFVSYRGCLANNTDSRPRLV